MMITKAESGKRKADRRQASTLSEVLVAIMILSVGIISLATLFPISILRSLQATQLTNGTILRYNAETAIEVTTSLVYDPNYNGNSTEHDGTNFLVDPLGFARSNGGNSISSLTRYPGLEKYDPTTGTYTQTQAITNALNSVTLPDSWVTLYEGVPTAGSLNAGRTSITLDSDDVTDVVVDVTQLNSIISSSVEMRAILYSPNERSSQVRPITAMISGTTVAWTDALPSTYTSVPRIRIQTREDRYSWLLTVRRASGAGVALVDVVIFFRRPDPPTGETGYDAAFVAGSQEASIRFTGDGPDLRQGGYVLDATNAHWYRIQKITETAGGAKLQLGRPALETGNKAVVMEGVVDVYPIGNKLP